MNTCTEDVVGKYDIVIRDTSDGVDPEAAKFLWSICFEISNAKEVEHTVNGTYCQRNLPRTQSTEPTEHSGSGNTDVRKSVDMERSRMELKIIKNAQDEPTLEAAQRFVGGPVQGITFPNGDYLLLNEHGKMMKLKENPTATKLWHASLGSLSGHDDWVSGPAILIKKTALKHWT